MSSSSNDWEIFLYLDENLPDDFADVKDWLREIVYSDDDYDFMSAILRLMQSYYYKQQDIEKLNKLVEVLKNFYATSTSYEPRETLLLAATILDRIELLKDFYNHLKENKSKLSISFNLNPYWFEVEADEGLYLQETLHDYEAGIEDDLGSLSYRIVTHMINGQWENVTQIFNIVIAFLKSKDYSWYKEFCHMLEKGLIENTHRKFLNQYKSTHDYEKLTQAEKTKVINDENDILQRVGDLREVKKFKSLCQTND